MKYFLFDIGNVLTNFDFPRLLQIFAEEGGKPLLPHTEQDQKWYDLVEKGLISDEEYVGYLNESKGLSWTVDDLTTTWSEIFSINPVGRRLFEKAVERGVAVYTLSNIAQYHVDAIENNWNGFFDDATGLFMSYKMGVRKPDPTIYRMALEHLGASGEQCFFIDDMEENVAAARVEGIHAHHFVPENHKIIQEAAAKFFGLTGEGSN
jgi:putative hydrolase of the HAD superfamily